MNADHVREAAALVLGFLEERFGNVDGNDWSDERAGFVADELEAALAALEAPKPDAPSGEVVPILMVLHCPACRLQHVDEPDERTPDWSNPPHRSHLCHGCGHIWRPADVPTNGVKATATRGKNDSAPPPPASSAPTPEDALPLPTGPRPDPNHLAWILSGMPKVGRTSIDLHVFDSLRAEVNARGVQLAEFERRIAEAVAHTSAYERRYGVGLTLVLEVLSPSAQTTAKT